MIVDNLSKKLISVVGATASGKTRFAVKLAKKFQTEIISCDSRQFYKELKIGSAIPSESEMEGVKHHFIAHKSITEIYNVVDFEKEALEKIEKLFHKYSHLILVGGSGLYEKAITQGLNKIIEIPPKIREEINKNYQMFGLKFLQQELQKKDKKYFENIDINNPHRLIRGLEVIQYTGKSILFFQNQIKKKRFFHVQKIGLEQSREYLYKKINQRVDLMITNGLIEEAKLLIPYKNHNALKTVGYTELFHFFEEKLPLEFFIQEIKKNSRRYAKRQLTWFKKDKSIRWINPLIESI